MGSEIIFDYIAPVVPVRDLDAALARYAALGFTAEPYAGGERYGFVERGGIHLRLSEWSGHDPGSTSTHVYLYVSDADALHAEWAAAGSVGDLSGPGDCSGGKLELQQSPPYDTEDGLRGFSLIDAQGTLHRVDSPLSR
jgi:hypothetical protein